MCARVGYIKINQHHQGYGSGLRLGRVNIHTSDGSAWVTQVNRKICNELAVKNTSGSSII